MSLTVIAGLGNPGDQYRDTRHNVGFTVLDEIAATHRVEWKRSKRFEALVAESRAGQTSLLLVKPETFMNESGRSLGAIKRYRRLRADAFIIVYDDITLPPMRAKLSVQGGVGGHNGVESVREHVGPGFVRYRVGIGGKSHPEQPLSDFVLSRFSDLEKQLLQLRLRKFVEDLDFLLAHGVVQAMNRINRKNDSHEPDPDQT